MSAQKRSRARLLLPAPAFSVVTARLRVAPWRRRRVTCNRLRAPSVGTDEATLMRSLVIAWTPLTLSTLTAYRSSPEWLHRYKKKVKGSTGHQEIVLWFSRDSEGWIHLRFEPSWLVTRRGDLIPRTFFVVVWSFTEWRRTGMVRESVQCCNIPRRRRFSAKPSFKCTSLCFAYLSGMKVVVLAHEKYFLFNEG